MLHILDSLSLYLANFETSNCEHAAKVNSMFPSIDFLLATTAIVIIIVCYVVLLAKLKPSNEPFESSDFLELLQETEENLSVSRRKELLEKYKEERIKDYLNKKGKSEGS